MDDEKTVKLMRPCGAEAYAIARAEALRDAMEVCEGVMDAANERARNAAAPFDAYEECFANGAANCIAAINAMGKREKDQS